VDEAMLTGEPLPVAKAKGAQVSAGTINGNGALVIAATHVGADTALAQIIQMVQDAQGARLPIQDLVNRVTGLFVPVVLLLAVLTVLVWLVLGPDPALGLALVAGVSVLIVACPCAMGLATPMSIMVGTGRAAEQGVLFRGGDALQNLQAVDAIAFDKTRTLTEGRTTLTGLQTADGFDADTVLTLAASLEAQSEHPIAQAVVMAAADKGIHPLAVSDFAAVTGMGITGQVCGQSVRIGAERFMPEGAALTLDAAFDAGGRSVFYIAIDGVLAGALAVSDPVRAEAAGMVSALKSMGLRVALITGDTQSAADALAEKVGINDVVAGVLPAGKSDALDRLAAGGKVAFVGDGINDAPALAKADVGIAIGTGTDVAIEAADVVLMAHDLMAVTRAVQISRATLRNIKQNLFWAFAYNAALIPVAAGLLYPVWGVLLSPMLAAGAMALSSVFVVTNALRLRWA
jgi:Cu+-exporting ATPase